MSCKFAQKTNRRTCQTSWKGRRVIRSFNDIVLNYIRERRNKESAELSFYKKIKSLDDAIEKAAKAETKEGNKHSHQWRISNKTLAQAAKILSGKRAEIRRCLKFQNLIEVVEKLIGRIEGVGELVIYDTALRIGANLGILPQHVYLHRGTRKGAKALGFATGRKYLEVRELPREFSELKPYEIEDCLCIYARDLYRLKK